MERLYTPVECRASDHGPMLYGVLLQEGRAARGGRAELFAPGAAHWPDDGVAIRTEHLATEHTRAVPTRGADGVITIEAPATPPVFAAVQSGKRYLSVEFHTEAEVRTAGGVREIGRALLTGAAPGPQSRV